MIPVKEAPEPVDFDTKVRQPGLSAIDELVGRPPRITNRKGRQRKKIANSEAEIPASKFPPYWREALPDMLTAYRRLCSFLAQYLELGTGNPTVDHMIPKSRSWDNVYEWSNYRLCAALVNTRKNDHSDMIDPFEVGEGWFRLEFVGFQVLPTKSVPANLQSKIQSTIELLNLPDFCTSRSEYVLDYEANHIDIHHLERRAPFIASELRRQGKLHPQDQ